jgi:hypothetical protein
MLNIVVSPQTIGIRAVEKRSASTAETRSAAPIFYSSAREIFAQPIDPKERNFRARESAPDARKKILPIRE